MPMTYAMSMLSKVMSDTVRTDMSTNRIETVTVTMNKAATTQTRGAMKIAAQSVVAFCP